jgi:hypothetical protein
MASMPARRICGTRSSNNLSRTSARSPDDRSRRPLPQRLIAARSRERARRYRARQKAVAMTAIFGAAVVPIMVMVGVLEAAKLVTAAWPARGTGTSRRYCCACHSPSWFWR